MSDSDWLSARPRPLRNVSIRVSARAKRFSYHLAASR